MDAVGYALAQNVIPYKWRNVTVIPNYETFARTVVVGSKAYVLSKNYLRSYDFTNGTWSNLKPIPTGRGRDRFTMCTGSGKLYVLGGFTDDAYVGLFDIYDIASDAWSIGPDIPKYPPEPGTVAPDRIGILDASCQYLNGSIYLIGGRFGVGGTISEGACTSVVYAFDTLANTWSMKRRFPTAIAELGTVVVGSYIYSLGGFQSKTTTTGDIYYSSIYKYDPTIDLWLYQDNIISARSGVASTYLDDSIYILGGNSSIFFEGFTPSSKAHWLEQPQNVIRSYFDLVAYNGSLFAFGGDANGTVDAFYKTDVNHSVLLSWLATQ